MFPTNICTDSIQKLLWKIGLPAGWIFFLTAFFNATDAYWVGQLGVQSATAMGVSFPIFLLITVIATGFGTAVTTVLGNAIGSRDEKHVTKYLEHMFFLAIVLVLILTPLLLILTPIILSISGDPDPVVQALSFRYIIPIVSFFIVFFYSFIFNGILNAYGDTKTYSRMLVIATIANMGLDPLLMLGIPGILPAFGIAGVAWSTIFIQIGMLLFLVNALDRRGIFARCHYRGWRPQSSVIREILHTAAPITAGMVTIAVGIFVINAYLNDFGTIVMGVYGVANQISNVMLLPIIGLSVATTVIIAQNHGAKKFARVRLTYYLALLNAGIILVPLAVIVWYSAPTIFHYFIAESDPTKQAEILHKGTAYVFVDICTYWAYAILYITVNAMQAIEKPSFGLWIGIYRQIVAPLIVFSLIVSLGGNYLGVWWGISGVNWSAAIIGLLYGWAILRRMR